MNKERRRDIRKSITFLDEAREALEIVKDDEEESFENLPEGIQCSERGEKMEEAISVLEDVISSLEDHVESLGEL